VLIARAATAAALALAAGASIAGVVPVDPFGTNQVGTQADGRVLLPHTSGSRRTATGLR
jgi:hypothetical protein